MTVVQSILLGLLQGIAEFLPISSSGHLKVCQKLFNLENVPVLFDVILHLATLLAVCIYFRKTIAKLFCVLGRWIARKPRTEPEDLSDRLSGTEQRGRKTIIAVILTTIVTGAIGVVTSKLIDDDSFSVKITCAGFIVTAVLLVVSAIIEKKCASKNTDEKEQNKDDGGSVSWIQALIIGLMQGVGTLPGISRSGSTIAGSQFCGVDRSTAGVYSLIVSIPAILGAFVLELKDLGEMNETVGVLPLIAGCVVAFVSGYLSLTLLMKMIKSGKLALFACYLVPAGILGMLFL